MNLKNIHLLLVVICISSISCKTAQKNSVDPAKVSWIQGADDCTKNADPLIQTVQFNYNTWIFRQNKCVNYEAPFLFLFLGKEKVLLMDTGATGEEAQFPLYKTVRSIIELWEKSIHHKTKLIVAHTHAHGDHTAGDMQFKGKPNTTVIGLDTNNVKSFFKIVQWPSEIARHNLGNRTIEVIPIPGHEKSSIAIYDHETKVLLTGDSFYPGRLYVRDWAAYKSSIQRLTEFTQTHPVSYLLGNHIEMMNKPGKDYPTGTTYQPDEHILPLSVSDLKLLNESLKRIGDVPAHEIHDDFIIVPKN